MEVLVKSKGEAIGVCGTLQKIMRRYGYTCWKLAMKNQRPDIAKEIEGIGYGR
jgi:hypothetical protein